MLQDLFHYIGSDLSTDTTGDLLTVSGVTLTRQRILRRLLTPPGSYVAQPTYGAGLTQFIGQAIAVDEITSLIRGQLALEDSVAQSPAPTVVVQQLPNDPTAFNVSITYTDAQTGQQDVLTFNVSSNGAT